MTARSIRDQRRGVVGWTLAIVGVTLMYAAVYPSIQASAAELRDYVQKLPDAIKTLVGEDYTSPAGYLRSELFSTMGPLLFLIFAIGAGARATAGEEERQTLDLLLATPIRRRDIVTSKSIATLLTLGVLGLATFATVALIGPLFDLSMSTANLAAACLMLVFLGMAFGSVALAIGTATGRRVFADAVAAGLAVVGYIVNALAPSVGWLRPLRPFSPMRWYLEPDPLRTGLHVASVAVLIGIAVALFALAQVAFRRRDVHA